VSSVVCDVLDCGEKVRLSEKLSERANRVAPWDYPTIPSRTPPISPLTGIIPYKDFACSHISVCDVLVCIVIVTWRYINIHRLSHVKSMSFTEHALAYVTWRSVIVRCNTAGDEDCAAGRVTTPQSSNINFSRNIVSLAPAWWSCPAGVGWTWSNIIIKLFCSCVLALLHKCATALHRSSAMAKYGRPSQQQLSFLLLLRQLSCGWRYDWRGFRDGWWYVCMCTVDDVPSQSEGRHAEDRRTIAVQTVPHRTVFQPHVGRVRRHRTPVCSHTTSC